MKDVLAHAGVDPVGFLPCLLLVGLVLILVELHLRVTVGRRSTASTEADRQVSIDGLRGFLALGVFIHHYFITYRFHASGRWELPDIPAYALVGKAGVAMFFMITGFLFWGRVLSKQGRLDWKQLAISRFFRIIPLYVLAVGLLVAAVFFKSQWQLNEPIHRIFAEIGAWLLFGTPDINKLQNTWIAVAGVTWTLQYEWLFYLSLPPFARILRIPVWGRWLLGGIALLLIALAVFPVSAFGLDTRYLAFFLIGALAAHAHRSNLLRRIATGQVCSHIALLALTVLFFRHGTVHGIPQWLLLSAAFIPVALGNTMYGLLSHRSAVFLGNMSYGIYLLHGLVLFFVFSLIFPDFLSSNRTFGTFWGGLAGTMLLVLVVSRLGFRLVEEPFIEVGKRIHKQLLQRTCTDGGLRDDGNSVNAIR